MDRKEYLQLCQKCSVLPERSFGTKNVPLELTVMYNGIRYYPAELRIWFDKNGNTRNTAVLHDMYANSVTNCDLERVERFEQKRDI